MTAYLLPWPRAKFFAPNTNYPLAGGKVYTYVAGTSTPLATYTDSSGSTPNANPVILDANGEAPIYLGLGLSYKINILDASGIQVPGYPVDNVIGSDTQLRSDLANTSNTALGAGLIGYFRSLTGWIGRTVSNKLFDQISVKDFGAIGDGVNDDTAAIQAALNSGAKGIYFPSATYLCGAITVPNTFGMTLYGDGTSSILKQKAGTGTMVKWSQSSMVYNEQTVKDLTFDGTSGTGHCLDTTGNGGLTLKNIYITNIPVGYSGIYVNGVSPVYTHDIRILGLQIYSNTAGHSGVRFGPYASDSDLSDLIMNGNFVTNYCIYMDSGALTLTIRNSHPYNASINVMYCAGNNSQCSYSGVVFDNALADIVHLVSSSNCTFTDCYFEAIPSGFIGASLVNTNSISFINFRSTATAGAVAAISESGTSDYTIVIGGNISSSLNYTNIFSFTGANSYARNIPGYSAQGLIVGFTGATQSAQAQNTSQFLGVNGIQSTFGTTAYVAPYNGKITTIYIACETTPSAGQTFTFQARKNGSNIGPTLVINNGSFNGTIAVNTDVTQYDQVAISSIFSATSGSSNIRYVATIRA